MQMEAPKTLADATPRRSSTAINYQRFYKAFLKNNIKK